MLVLKGKEMTTTELAKQMAEYVHKGQTRWNGDPYITHPQRVAESLKGNNLETIALAWMHDCIEDASEDMLFNIKVDIISMFGKRFYQQLLLLTHNSEDTYAEYLAKVATDKRCTMVKLADLKDNLSDLRPGQRRQKYEVAVLYLETCGEKHNVIPYREIS